MTGASYDTIRRLKKKNEVSTQFKFDARIRDVILEKALAMFGPDRHVVHNPTYIEVFVTDLCSLGFRHDFEGNIIGFVATKNGTGPTPVNFIEMQEFFNCLRPVIKITFISFDSPYTVM